MSTPDCNVSELDLQALADGELAGTARAELEAHAADCARCTRFLEEERALAAKVAALPRAIAPAPEVWSAIQARIDVRPLKTRSIFTQRAVQRAAGGFALAAAAALAIVASRPTAPLPPAPSVATVNPPAPTEAPFAAPAKPLRPEEAPYAAALSTLEADFAKAKAALPEGAAHTVEENLRVIDTAIETMRGALSTTPDDLDLQSQLAALYQQKIRVETDVIDLAARI